MAANARLCNSLPRGCGALAGKKPNFTPSLHIIRPLCTADKVNADQRRELRVYNVTHTLVPYAEAWDWQHRLLRERIAWQRESPPNEGHDVLLVLEHPSVYTLGRGSSLEHLRFDPADPDCPHEVHRTERGGEVTWHGPGQVVAYPILDLNFHRRDLHWYLRLLEEVVVRCLAFYDLRGERDTEHTGVWVGGAKYAAIGLNASRWVTTHGLALNVQPDMRNFERIVPCGIVGRHVGCIADGVSAAAAPSVSDVRKQLIECFEDVFGVRAVEAGPECIPPPATAATAEAIPAPPAAAAAAAVSGAVFGTPTAAAAAAAVETPRATTGLAESPPPSLQAG